VIELGPEIRAVANAVGLEPLFAVTNWLSCIVWHAAGQPKADWAVMLAVVLRKLLLPYYYCLSSLQARPQFQVRKVLLQVDSVELKSVLAVVDFMAPLEALLKRINSDENAVFRRMRVRGWLTGWLA
jgi:hypothetical protein